MNFCQINNKVTFLEGRVLLEHIGGEEKAGTSSIKEGAQALEKLVGFHQSCFLGFFLKANFFTILRLFLPYISMNQP